MSLKKDEDYISEKMEDNFEFDKLSEESFNEMLRKKQKQDRLEEEKKRHRKKLFHRMFMVAAPLVLVLVVTLTTVFSLRGNGKGGSGDIYYADDQLSFKTLTEEELAIYYDGKISLADYSNEICLFFTKDTQTPIYIQLTYIDINQLDQIKVMIILSNQYNGTLIYEICQSEMKVNDISVRYFTDGKEEPMFASLAKFIFNGHQFYIDAEYFQVPEMGDRLTSFIEQLTA